MYIKVHMWLVLHIMQGPCKHWGPWTMLWAYFFNTCDLSYLCVFIILLNMTFYIEICWKTSIIRHLHAKMSYYGEHKLRIIRHFLAWPKKYYQIKENSNGWTFMSWAHKSSEWKYKRILKLEREREREYPTDPQPCKPSTCKVLTLMPVVQDKGREKE